MIATTRLLQSAAESKLRTILLQKLKASTVVVDDISGGCGSMYNVQVASTVFKGLKLLEQHRMVSDALKDEIKGMHGIQIKTSVPPTIE